MKKTDIDEHIEWSIRFFKMGYKAAVEDMKRTSKMGLIMKSDAVRKYIYDNLNNED